jgi:hypothetical protein
MSREGTSKLANQKVIRKKQTSITVPPGNLIEASLPISPKELPF